MSKIRRWFGLGGEEPAGTHIARQEHGPAHEPLPSDDLTHLPDDDALRGAGPANRVLSTPDQPADPETGVPAAPPAIPSDPPDDAPDDHSSHAEQSESADTPQLIELPSDQAEPETSPAGATAPEDALDDTRQEPSPDQPAGEVGEEDHAPDTLLPGQDAPAEHTAPSAVDAPEQDTEETVPAADAGYDTPLAPGTIVADRFTIAETLTLDQASAMLGSAFAIPEAQLYAVDDRLGYTRCWSCGSTNNEEQQRFCVDCGAPLHRQAVLARTATPTGESEEFAEGSTYFHQVQPRKQFGNTGVSLEVGGCSAEGPHHPNEDSYWSATVGGCFDSRSAMIGVAVLADGMGGYAPGSGLISREIVTTVGSGIFALLHAEPNVPLREADMQALVRGAIATANGKVLEQIRLHGEMGSTLVATVIYGQTAYVANIGDSRAYYVAPSGAVTQITRDQSLVEQQVAAGLLSPDAVYTALGNNVILHAIGEEAVEESSDWYIQPLEPGSRLLLCSDGYWKTMGVEVWTPEAAKEHSTLRDLARALVDDALARGSDDNTTVLVVGID